MFKTDFWKPNRSNISKAFSNISIPGVKMPNVPDIKSNKAIKIFGVFFSFILVIFFVLGAVSYFVLVKPAYSVLSNVNILKADVSDLRGAIIGRDLVSFEKTLTKTESDLNDLRQSREKNFGWAKNFGPSKAYYEDSDYFINAALDGIAAGRELSTLISPFADAAGLKVREDQQAKETGLAEAVSIWISLMPQVANDLDKVIVKLDSAGTELSKIDANRYPQSFRGVAVRDTIESAQRNLSSLSENAPDIKQALNTIPKILGVGGVGKRYMIIMQNNKEQRPTGGFMTNYATFKVRNALLDSDFTSKDMYSIDNTLDIIDKTYDFPDPPVAYTKYLKVERLYARDSNYNPDFPLSMDKFLSMYNLAGRISPMEIKPVDGIFAIDTDVISELLNVTGPVTVNGFTYDSNNVVLELEKLASLALREQVGRKRVLGYLMGAMLQNVFESEKNLWPKLIDKAVDLMLKKHILVYLLDPQAETLVEKYNLAGRITDPVEGDYDYFVSTNLGGDKTSGFIKKDYEHILSKEDDKWVRTDKVKYTYIQPSNEWTPFVTVYRDWFRLYVPSGATLISVDGSEDGSSTEQLSERNKTYFTGYMTLAPYDTKEIMIKYYLPATVKIEDIYNLLIQKQPGNSSEDHVVTVNGVSEKVTIDRDYNYSKKL